MFSSKLVLLAISATAVYAVPAPQLISSLSPVNGSITVDGPSPTSANFSIPADPSITLVPSAIPTEPFSIASSHLPASPDAPYAHHGHHHGGFPIVVTITETVTVNPGGPISSASSIFDPSASVSNPDIPATTEVLSEPTLSLTPTSVTDSAIPSSFTISSSTLTNATVTPSASSGSASASGSDLPSGTAIPSVDPSVSASASA